ncbi:MAG: hypothetical protein ACP5HM_04830 [Anaerolineae bacterium]
MPSETKMSIDSRYEYLQQMQTLYRQATNRTEKSQLLNERHARQGERGDTYGPDVDAALRLIWEAHDYICPERLSNATLLRTARALARDGELALPLEVDLVHHCGPLVRQIALCSPDAIMKDNRGEQRPRPWGKGYSFQ